MGGGIFWNLDLLKICIPKQLGEGGGGAKGDLEKSKYFLNDGVPKEKLDMDLIIRQEMKWFNDCAHERKIRISCGIFTNQRQHKAKEDNIILSFRLALDESYAVCKISFATILTGSKNPPCAPKYYKQKFWKKIFFLTPPPPSPL